MNDDGRVDERFLSSGARASQDGAGMGIGIGRGGREGDKDMQGECRLFCARQAGGIITNNWGAKNSAAATLHCRFRRH